MADLNVVESLDERIERLENQIDIALECDFSALPKLYQEHAEACALMAEQWLKQALVSRSKSQSWALAESIQHKPQ